MEVVKEIRTRPLCECCLKCVDVVVNIPINSVMGQRRKIVGFCAKCLLKALESLEADKPKKGRAPTGMYPTH